MTIRMPRRLLGAVAFVTMAGPALPALAAATDYLLDLGDVKGESKIEVSSPFDPPVRAGACSGPIAGGSAMINIKNPELVRMVSTGKFIAKAKMFGRKAGAGAEAYTYELKNVMVTSITGAPAGQVQMTYAGGTWTKQGCR